MEEIFKLSPLEQVDIVETILTNFESADRKKIDSLWEAESEKRIDLYLQGKIKAKPMNEIFDKLNNGLFDESSILITCGK